MAEEPPNCQACREFYAINDKGFCSQCYSVWLYTNTHNNGRAIKKPKDIAAMAHFQRIVSQVDQDDRDREKRLRTTLQVARLPKNLDAYAVLRTLCDPLQPWSYRMIGKICHALIKDNVRGLSTEMALPVMEYFAEHFSHNDHGMLALQCCVAARIQDRYNLRRLFHSGAHPLISAVVDCYYGSADVEIFLAGDSGGHAKSLWINAPGIRGRSDFKLLPKTAYDWYYHAILCLSRGTSVTGSRLPKDMIKLMATRYLAPVDWTVDNSEFLLSLL